MLTKSNTSLVYRCTDLFAISKIKKYHKEFVDSNIIFYFPSLIMKSKTMLFIIYRLKT